MKPTNYYVTRGRVQRVWTNKEVLFVAAVSFALAIFLSQILAVAQEANRVAAWHSVQTEEN